MPRNVNWWASMERILPDDEELAGAVASELREHLVTECNPEGNGRLLQVASVVYPHDAASAPEVMERVEHILGLDGGRPLPAATRVACG